MEAQLFRGWNELPPESPEELEGLMQVSPKRTTEPQQAAAGNLRAGTNDLQVSDEASEIKAPQTPPSSRKTSMRGAAKARTAEKKPVTESLTELQQALELKMEASAQKRAEHRALRALHSASTATEEATPSGDGMTAWAHNLDDIMHELQDHMKARHKARAEHAAVHAASHAAATSHQNQASPQPGGTSQLLSEVQALGEKMCQDPERRDRPACAQFRHSSTAESSLSAESRLRRQHHKERHEDAMAHIKLLEKHLEDLKKEQAHDTEEIQHASTEILKELCADPARNSYPICASVLPATTTPAPAATKGLRGKSSEVHNLHWSAVKNQPKQDRPLHSGVSQLVLHRRALRGAHWEGKIPKVACITVLPQGHVTETLMKYFMDNYKLQHYDGERQLVIIYHSADHEASRIAHLYADGSSIIAAAARGGGAFPSATAYRYGSWLAKGADVVARWDFDAWHHPNRLSMQVRAVATATRPASVVARITVFDADGNNATIPGGTGPHGSIIGDAAWMQKHWTPILEEESSMIHGMQSSAIVQVDMPELIAYHDMSGPSKA